MCYKPLTLKNRGNFRGSFGMNQMAFDVPCRKCADCRQKRANEWALRCYSEFEKTKLGFFITLTYEESPIFVKKRPLQLFLKRLRKSLAPKTFKFFAAGEYGSKNFRPHFHLILMGTPLPDLRPSGLSSGGNQMFTSNFVEKIWGLGLVSVQNLTFETCAYSALYSSAVERELPLTLSSYPEFNLMSKNLGVDFLLGKVAGALASDRIFVDGFSYPIPNFVLSKFLEKIKREKGPFSSEFLDASREVVYLKFRRFLKTRTKAEIARLEKYYPEEIRRYRCEKKIFKKSL